MRTSGVGREPLQFFFDEPPQPAITQGRNLAISGPLPDSGGPNRKEFSGYKVVFVPFAEGRPSGPPVDFLSGFLTREGKAKGRPVGVVVDKAGALLVADDVGNVVWRVTPAAR